MIVHHDPSFWYAVECAVRSDGSSPAREFLDQLKQGMWADDPDSAEIPDDEQVKDYHRLVNLIRTVAREGEPERARSVEYLGHGIWEFKVARKRLAFYDTDGSGNFSPKPKINDIANSPSPRSATWWLPEFDRVLRLANAWPKTGEKADQIDIEEAVKIREEDLHHDQQD